MPLKITCPRCKTLHRNIDKTLLGKTFQCPCGKVVRLGKPTPTPERPDPVPIETKPRPRPVVKSVATPGKARVVERSPSAPAQPVAAGSPGKAPSGSPRPGAVANAAVDGPVNAKDVAAGSSNGRENSAPSNPPAGQTKDANAPVAKTRIVAPPAQGKAASPQPDLPAVAATRIIAPAPSASASQPPTQVPPLPEQAGANHEPAQPTEKPSMPEPKNWPGELATSPIEPLVNEMGGRQPLSPNPSPISPKANASSLENRPKNDSEGQDAADQDSVEALIANIAERPTRSRNDQHPETAGKAPEERWARSDTASGSHPRNHDESDDGSFEVLDSFEILDNEDDVLDGGNA